MAGALGSLTRIPLRRSGKSCKLNTTNSIRKIFGGCIALAALPLLTPALGAEGNGQGVNGQSVRRESGTLQDISAGVVTNQTVTFIGQRFFREFAALWYDKSRADRYSLAIFERPSARWGSLIWVEYANRRVFQTFVSPGRMDLQVLSQRAVELAYQNVVSADLQKQLLKEPDVGPDEI